VIIANPDRIYFSARSVNLWNPGFPGSARERPVANSDKKSYQGVNDMGREQKSNKEAKKKAASTPKEKKAAKNAKKTAKR
jgi:hypothetical protein